MLDRLALQDSMSRKGNCWVNTVMERSFLNLKMRRVWRRDYANPQEAVCDVTDYIVGFYKQSASAFHTELSAPNGFERKMADEQPIGVPEKT